MHQHNFNFLSASVLAYATQELLMDVLTCADVLQTGDNAHFFVFEEAMRCGGCDKPCCAHWN
jgi:hypothetical protein